MTVSEAYDNYWELRKCVSLLIKLAIKINTQEQPQQVDLCLDVLRKLDHMRIKQHKVARDYNKTADRLGELRGMWKNEVSNKVPDGYKSWTEWALDKEHL